MEINKISKENTNQIIDIIINDRLDELKRLLDEEVLKDEDEFILTEIFDPQEWGGIHDYPGNWEVGRKFGPKLKESKLPIIRHPEGKKRDQGAVYLVKF